MSRALKLLMLITDAGLLSYWCVTAIAAAGVIKIAPEFLFADYSNALVAAWNWSFMPIDVVLSFAGLTSVRLASRDDDRWRHWATISLSLTMCAGLMAISFWTIRADFEPAWWLPNIFLIVWPVPFLLRGIVSHPAEA